MCGICGVFEREGPGPDAALLESMNECLRHRGPDESGSHLEPGLGLAMRRLSIIDVAGSHQPVGNEDGSVVAVFNGEIYNYRDLRRELQARGHRLRTEGDSETLVHLYEEHGADLVHHLRGMFAFAIWDRRERKLLLARDRFGKKPLYYADTGERLLFASELKALLPAEPERDIDLEAVLMYLRFAYIPAPRTIFRAVRKLPPGSYLIAANGRARVHRYWKLRREPHDGVTGEEAERRLLTLLEEATGIRLVSEVPLGAFLSGGLDSSLVVAMMARRSPERIKTFSIGFAEGGYSELPYATLAARAIGTDHREMTVKPDCTELLPRMIRTFDEPFADTTAIPQYLLSVMTREHVTVALAGDGGDELFAGYRRYLRFRLLNQLAKVPAGIRRGIGAMLETGPATAMGQRAAGWLRHAAEAPEDRYLAGLRVFSEGALASLVADRGLAGALTTGSAKELFRAVTGRDGSSAPGLLELLEFDTEIYLPDDILTKVDRTSMACSLEVRAPFLDHELAEFVATLPETLLLRGRETKWILKRAAAKVLPRSIVERKKHGFTVPVTEWLRGPLAGMVRDLLGRRSVQRRGLFDPGVVAGYVDDHLERGIQRTEELWALVNLELWFRTFVDRRDTAERAGEPIGSGWEGDVRTDGQS